jgi:ABC-type uncharacterized transport system ATPase subunit
MSRGEIILEGKPAYIRSPKEAIAQGFFCAPEDRKRDGLCVKMCLSENITLPSLDLVSRMGIIRHSREVKKTKEMVQSLKIKTTGVDQYVRNLSGGNQQKVIIAREVSSNPELLIASQPTRGLDVGAIEFIHGEILKLREKYAAVLLISFELDEIVELSDRIAVIYEGRIVAMLDADKTDVNEIGIYMAGGHKDETN